MNITIFHVDVVDENNIEIFKMGIEFGEPGEPPTRMLVVRPLEVFETRAAEYEFDPNDMELLLRVVLYESFLEEDGVDDGLRLHAAPTLEEARVEYLRRIAEVQGDGKIISQLGDSFPKPTSVRDVVVAGSEEGCPVSFLLREVHMDPEYYAVKREYTKEISRTVKAYRKEKEEKEAAARPVMAARVGPVRRPRVSVAELERRLFQNNMDVSADMAGISEEEFHGE